MEDLSPSELREMAEKDAVQAAADFEEFKQAVADRVCWTCKEALASFDESKPCVHWLLNPPGFKKKCMTAVFENFTQDRIETYLRWTVASDGFIKGINDIRDEHTVSKILALTIKRGDLEWSFDCSQNCFEGKNEGQPPHYHFQMRVDGRPFINYSEFHIPLSPYEVWVINAKAGKIPGVLIRDKYGIGFDAAVKDAEPDALLHSMRTAPLDEDATFHLSTMMEANDEGMISGDEVAALIKESQKTGVPMAVLVNRLSNVTKQVIIEPGPAIPDAAPRTPRKRGKGRNYFVRDFDKYK